MRADSPERIGAVLIVAGMIVVIAAALLPGDASVYAMRTAFVALLVGTVLRAITQLAKAP